MMDGVETLYKRLKDAREQLNFSQDDVAKALGIRRAAISEIESGQRKVSADELAAFSRLYDKSMNELFYGEKTEQEETQDFIKLFNQLSVKDKKEIINMIRLKQNKQLVNYNVILDDDEYIEQGYDYRGRWYIDRDGRKYYYDGSIMDKTSLTEEEIRDVDAIYNQKWDEMQAQWDAASTMSDAELYGTYYGDDDKEYYRDEDDVEHEVTHDYYYYDDEEGDYRSFSYAQPKNSTENDRFLLEHIVTDEINKAVMDFVLNYKFFDSRYDDKGYLEPYKPYSKPYDLDEVINIIDTLSKTELRYIMALHEMIIRAWNEKVDFKNELYRYALLEYNYCIENPKEAYHRVNRNLWQQWSDSKHLFENHDKTLETATKTLGSPVPNDEEIPF